MSEMMIPVGQLEPHERAQNFWPDSEDRRGDQAGIRASVAEIGVRRPLLVTPKKNGEGYWIVDGCTRYEAAVACGITELKCDVQEIDDDAIDDEVFVSNMDRTRFASGLRVMKYMERHLNEVLETARRNEDPAACGAKGGRGKKACANDTGYDSKAIAERLGVSNKDVLRGIELLRCRYDNRTVKVVGSERRLVEATEKDREGIDAAYQAVLGGTSLRRWMPAAKGHAATSGKGKALTNLTKVALEGVIKLRTAFTGWEEIPFADRELITTRLETVFAAAPGDVRKLMTDLYGAAGKKAKQ